MPEIKKLTSEELSQIQELQKQFNQFVFELGSVESQLQNIYKAETELKKEKNDILEDLSKLNEREKVVIDNLQSKYGVGSINPQTGEISPL